MSNMVSEKISELRKNIDMLYTLSNAMNTATECANSAGETIDVTGIFEFFSEILQGARKNIDDIEEIIK